MNRSTYFLSILILLIFLISGVYVETVCKCKSNTKGQCCGVELDCIFDQNDDPNYGYSDIWQCGSETNFCWFGPCSDGCCKNINSESCCKGDLTCNKCDVFISPKYPGVTKRPFPKTCSYSSTGMSYPTPTDASPSSSNTSPPNTSPPNTSPTASPSDANPPNASPSDANPPNANPSDANPPNASPSDASPPNASPSDTSPSPPGKSKVGTIVGSTIGSILGLIIIIGIRYIYIRRKENNQTSDGYGHDDGDD